ncbi:MAG TPA: AraC family transcriptional regulator [Planctomicrobium sp.]|nr:AraC family transcriptional regulator [Planctomicrobium sp.]
MSPSSDPNFAYLPVPDTLVQLGLYITGAGKAVVPPGSSYPLEQHPDLYHFSWTRGRVLPEYQFLLISEGRGEFESDLTERQIVQPGTVMLLFPDIRHRYRPHRETGWTEYWLSVNGDLIFDWQERNLINPEQPLWHLKHPEETIAQYEAVIAAVTRDPSSGPTMNVARTLMILASIIDQRLPNETEERVADGKFDAPVKAALHEIWNHSHRRISVGTIAEGLEVSRRTLERRFQEQVGHSVLTELLNCRIERAQRLLRETSMSIKNVSYASGFGSVVSFCKLFQRKLQMTPSRYREETQRFQLNPRRRSGRTR